MSEMAPGFGAQKGAPSPPRHCGDPLRPHGRHAQGCVGSKNAGRAHLGHGEPQAGWGWGAPQVRGDPHRSEPSVGRAGVASWFVRRVGHYAMGPDKPGSRVQLQQAWRVRGMTTPVEQNGKVKMAKARTVASYLLLSLQGGDSEYNRLVVVALRSVHGETTIDHALSLLCRQRDHPNISRHDDGHPGG
jgi:hypothetical protein